MKLLDSPNTLSRRTWLRDTAIAATSAVVVPSMLIGCSDHRIPPGAGVGGPANPPLEPLTSAELKRAADNLKNMLVWLTELHGHETDYESTRVERLKSGEKLTGWADFIVNIITNIATGIIAVAAASIPGLGPAIGAGLALTGNLIKQFALSGGGSHSVDGAYADFAIALNDLFTKTQDTLNHLQDPAGVYKNLREGWPGDVEFNGKTYTLRDLATDQFPATGDIYVALQQAARLQFQKYFWTVMFIKAGTMTYSMEHRLDGSVKKKNGEVYHPIDYARDIHYKNFPASYFRGYWHTVMREWRYRYWYWTFDDRELTDATVNELFQDDTPERIINPDGLFLRAYVFKQFHQEKPDFWGHHELYNFYNPKGPLNVSDDCYGFDCPDNYEFIGGGFPALIKK